MTTERAPAAAITRESAQARADRIAAFRDELAQVERDGSVGLPAELRARLETYHDAVLRALAAEFDVDRDDRQRRMSLGMRLASLLGAVALSAAVFFFFYRYWGRLTEAAHLIVLTALPIALLAAVDVAARRERTLYVASLLALVASAAFALDLVVVGAQFNIVPTPVPFGAWGLFAIAVAYAYGLRLLLTAGLVALLVFTCAWPAWFAGLDWTSSVTRPEPIIAGGAILFAGAERMSGRWRAGFAPVFRMVGALAVYLPLLLVSGWGEFSYLPWPPASVEAVYDGLGFLLPAGGIWLGVTRRWPETVNVSAGFLVVFIYAKCIEWAWDWLPRYLFFLLLAAVAVGILVLLRRLRAHMRQV